MSAAGELANMGFKTKEKAKPLIAAFTLKLMQKYAGKKGIIHAQSYELMRYLVEYLTANGQGHRLVTHTNLPGSRDGAVVKHCTSPDDTVLISPSMQEGLDLKGDLSRFQIIPKIPFPALDVYTKARMDRDSAHYPYMTALSLVQETGRSVRSMDDRAHTWILDSGFIPFLEKNESILPLWWKDAIQFRPPWQSPI